MGSQMKTFNLQHAANDEDMTPVLHKTMLSLVRRDGADLTARQLGIFLTVYLERAPHTVRGLAAQFNICKPAVTRALDRLAELDLARRKVDPRDRRSVLVQRTETGWTFLSELRSSMSQAAAEAEWAPPPPARTRTWPKAVVNHRMGYEHGFAASSGAD